MKLKKMICAVVAAGMLISVTACGSSDGKTASADSDNAKQLEENSAEINDTVVKLDQPMSEVTEQLGETDNVEQAKSCMYDGYDKAFIYDDYTIRTYPKDDVDYVNSIEIYSADVEVSKEAHVGDSKDAVMKVYGDNLAFDTDTYFAYETEECGIAFYYTDDKINEIEIYKIAK